jgi:hypothetical protein
MFLLVFQIAAKIDTKFTLETKNGKNVSFNWTESNQSDFVRSIAARSTASAGLIATQLISKKLITNGD